MTPEQSAFTDVDLPAAYPLERELPSRTVVIGDLNGQVGLLRRLLLGLRLIRRDERWSGGRSVLVQMGDVPNRGGGVRPAMDLLLRLRDEARAAGGDVYWLLGNHEVMSVLRHEAYVWPDESLDCSRPEELEKYYTDRTRFMYELLGPPDRA
ncbi:MAG: metallophosphoesterase, partial [Myxococcota bacterium]